MKTPRVTKWLLVLLGLCLIGSAQASESGSGRWLWVSVVADEDDTDVDVWITFRGTFRGDAPLVQGSGIADPHRKLVSIGNIGADAPAVAGTRGTGGWRAQLTPGRVREFALSNDWTRSRLDQGERASVLFFIANGETTDIEVEVHFYSGAGTWTMTQGDGARALIVADPAHDGIGVGAGPIAGGAVSASISNEAGIVGGVADCTGCVVRWRSPDGRSGTALVRGIHAVVYGESSFYGDDTFAGPEGLWEWEWTGLAQRNPVLSYTGTPVLAAWAPVGDWWKEFRE